MDVVAAWEALTARGMDVLEAVATGRLTRDDMIRGQSGSAAGQWVALAEVYFGPTRSRRLQATAVAAARAGELPVAALQVIDKHTAKLLKGASVTEWELRAELCGLRGTVDHIDRQAAARVREINRTVQDAARKARAHRALKGGKNTDALGLRTITLTLPERDMSTMLAHLRPTADRLRRADPRLRYEQAMADALYTHALGGVPAHTPPPPIPHVVIPLPDYARLLRHDGDETIFGLTDGTTITGRELIEAEMARHHVVGIYCPVEGGINLYRESRTANPKQRMLLAAETLLCPAPECTTSADESQVHHLQAWKHGGGTNMDNLSIACRKHNARNDDDPHAPPRNGRLAREPGGVVLHPPDGGAPKTNRHPIRNLSAMGLLAEP